MTLAQCFYLEDNKDALSSDAAYVEYATDVFPQAYGTWLFKVMLGELSPLALSRLSTQQIFCIETDRSFPWMDQAEADRVCELFRAKFVDWIDKRKEPEPEVAQPDWEYELKRVYETIDTLGLTCSVDIDKCYQQAVVSIGSSIKDPKGYDADTGCRYVYRAIASLLLVARQLENSDDQ